MTKELETPSVIYRQYDNGILRATYRESVRVVNIHLARQIVSERLAFQGSMMCHLLVTELGEATYLPDARRYFISADGLKNLSSIAIVANSWITYATASFMISMRRFPIPIRIFLNENDAWEWLLLQIQIEKMEMEYAR